MRFKRLVLWLVGCGGSLVMGCASLTSADMGSDAELAAAIQDRLSQDAVTGRAPLGVSVDQGVATLSGSLRDAGARARALSIVRGTPGVRGVVDSTTR